MSNVAIVDDKIITYPDGVIKIANIVHVGKIFTSPTFGKGFKLLINDKYTLTFDSIEEGKKLKEKIVELMIK